MEALPKPLQNDAISVYQRWESVGTAESWKTGRGSVPENARPSYVIGPPDPLRSEAFPEYDI
jgi:hypothetical protein